MLAFLIIILLSQVSLSLPCSLLHLLNLSLVFLLHDLQVGFIQVTSISQFLVVSSVLLLKIGDVASITILEVLVQLCKLSLILSLHILHKLLVLLLE